jgi:hypothetical protein
MKSPIAVVSGSSQVIPRAAAQGDLAVVPEATTPPRTSKRRADTIAEPSLERAERLKAARNLDATTKKGNDITSHISFLQFSDDLVVDNLSAVGISLGDNVESIACSVDCVKEVELNRLHTTVDEDIISYVFDKEEKEQCEAKEVDKLILNSLCTDIMDEVMDLGNAYPPDYKITSRQRTSSSVHGSKLARSKSKKSVQDERDILE